MEIEIKYQCCLLSEAIVRNLNDRFESISFTILENGDVQTKIILDVLTEIEQELIDDLIVEYAARQLSDCVLRPIVEVGSGTPFENVVYQRQS